MALDIDADERLWWIEQNSSSVYNWNDDLRTPYSKKLEPQAMAIDYITDKLYVIDKEAETLNVIDMRYNYTGVVLSDLTRPHDIVLDPLVGLVFIIQQNNSVMHNFIVLK